MSHIEIYAFNLRTNETENKNVFNKINREIQKKIGAPPEARCSVRWHAPHSPGGGTGLCHHYIDTDDFNKDRVLIPISFFRQRRITAISR